jgi:predicted DsbA family dithiol-disulfide isomerase
VKVEHRAFLLVLREGSRPVFTEYHLAHRQAAAERTGLPIALPTLGAPYPLSSWPAQRAAAWVRQHSPESFEAFDEAVFRAFFQYNRDIADLKVLAEVSGLAELGMVPEVEIAHQHELAVSLGISSIPCVLIGEQVISGAADYEAYKTAVLSLEGHRETV